MKSQLWKIGKNILYTLWMPVVVYVFFSVLCAANGKTGFGVNSDLMIIFRNTVYSGFIALALSYNLTSGRFDFSIGSIFLKFESKMRKSCRNPRRHDFESLEI